MPKLDALSLAICSKPPRRVAVTPVSSGRRLRRVQAPAPGASFTSLNTVSACDFRQRPEFSTFRWAAVSGHRVTESVWAAPQSPPQDPRGHLALSLETSPSNFGARVTRSRLLRMRLGASSLGAQRACPALCAALALLPACLLGDLTLGKQRMSQAAALEVGQRRDSFLHHQDLTLRIASLATLKSLDSLEPWPCC